MSTYDELITLLFVGVTLISLGFLFVVVSVALLYGRG